MRRWQMKISPFWVVMNWQLEVGILQLQSLDGGGSPVGKAGRPAGDGDFKKFLCAANLLRAAGCLLPSTSIITYP
ncbi:MAG: hypothetical protein K9G49_13085 [Taibaiella sp.]|nr:hypothetical protein [Taibaiella sp.]